MTRYFSRALPAALLAAAVPAAAQQPMAPHPLGAVTQTAAEPFGSIMSVRHLPGGRVLVNDMARRKVVMLDQALATSTVIADSTSATANAYSGRVGNLIPYRGDSTLFVDPTSLSMLLIDPSGKVGRVMSIPRPNDAGSLASVGGGQPGFDAQGRLVYRSNGFRSFGPPPGAGGAGFQMPVFPDSAPILRVELATRKVDTAAFIKIPKINMSVVMGDNGMPRSMSSITNPLPVTDDWAVTATGALAVIRGQDYHVDWIGADGSKTSSPKMPFDWQRMNDEQKVAFLDSTKTAMEKMRATMMASGGPQAAGDGRRIVTDGAGGGGGGAPQVFMSFGGPGGGAPPQRGANAQGGPNGAAPNGGFQMPPITLVQPSELPDYKPPFATGAARADADGNIWVREIPTKPYPGPVYGIIDGKGQLIDRVVLPPGSAIAGFGPGGIVYLGVRDEAGVHLKRATVK
jgi:hypothetical protein